MNEQLEQFFNNNRNGRGNFVDKYAYITINSTQNIITIAALLDLILVEEHKPGFRESMKSLLNEAHERLGRKASEEVVFPED